MTKEEAKQWAELLTAYAEGKTIEHAIFYGNGAIDWVETTDIDLSNPTIDYRIKLELKTRRMTDQELSDWLRDNPQEHREYKYRHGESVSCYYDYDEDEANDPVGDIVIRRNHSKWKEPLIEVEE